MVDAPADALDDHVLYVFSQLQVLSQNYSQGIAGWVTEIGTLLTVYS